MRILLTTDTIGGVWTFTQELTEGLLQRGHSVCLVALGRSPSPSQQAWCDHHTAAFRDRFQTVCSPAPLEWMEGNDHALEDGVAVILAVAENFHPEVLHSSQFCFGALPTTYPKLITAHSDVLSWAEACRPEGLEPSPWLQTYEDIVNAGLRGADAITAPTAWMLRALSQHYPELPARQFVVPNGRTLSGDGLAGERKQQAVSVGRLWDAGKNVRMLAEVNTAWTLLVAGEQEFGGSSAPETLGHAQLLGALNSAQFLEFLRESSVYICTSMYEPFGLAPLEAALCGCALLLHDLPSLREVWGKSALYFRDAQELGSILRQLHESPHELMAQRVNSWQKAQHLTAAKMVESYLWLYEDLLGTPHLQTNRELSTLVH